MSLQRKTVAGTPQISSEMTYWVNNSPYGIPWKAQLCFAFGVTFSINLSMRHEEL